ncbi:hypothetical protein, partial [Pedococcus aerophilus]|uniref:hypothetical protein n=1 Tax=Pedococcus aerophilus TaxID=436356 RepID=UPI0031DAF1B7
FHVTDATWRECAFITTRPDTTITTWAAALRTDPAPQSAETLGDPLAAFLASAVESGLPHHTVTRFDPGGDSQVWLAGADAVHRIQITAKESGVEA